MSQFASLLAAQRQFPSKGTPSPVASPRRIESKASEPVLPVYVPFDRNRPVKNGKHLIFDLDETLVHTFTDYNEFSAYAGPLSDEQKKEMIYCLVFHSGEEMWGYIRPGAYEVIRAAFEEFQSVGVWSAGTPEYVDMLVKILFKDHPISYVWTRPLCEELILLADEKSERYKPLQNLYKTFPDHNSKNTLIVDDRIDVCRLNCMNALVVREYDYIPSQYDGYVNDTHLFSLAQFFRRPDVREAQDVHLILHKWQSEV